MLFLLFELEIDRYALPARDVVEVLPLVALKRIPRAPAGVAGVMEYRGQAVPVIDLCALVVGRAAALRVSTRILVVRHATATDRLVGLIAERATEMLRREETDFQPSGYSAHATRFLGPVTSDGRGFIQRVETSELIEDGLRLRLWAETEQAAV